MIHLYASTVGTELCSPTADVLPNVHYVYCLFKQDMDFDCHLCFGQPYLTIIFDIKLGYHCRPFQLEGSIGRSHMQAHMTRSTMSLNPEVHPPAKDSKANHKIPLPTSVNSIDPKLNSAQEVYEALQACYNSGLAGASAENEYLKFTLPHREYHELLNLFSKEPVPQSCFLFHSWFLEEARYDYDPPHLSFHMLSAGHELLAASVIFLTRIALNEIALKYPVLALIIRKILTMGSPDIFFGENPDSPKRIADGVIWVSGYAFPSIIYEVAYSRTLSSLAAKAEDYFRASNRNIRCVVGFDLTYTPPGVEITNHKATVSIWRPKLVTNLKKGEKHYECALELDAVVFRDEAGVAQDGSLKIPLSDVIHPSELNTVPPPQRELCICIPFKDLCNKLDKAERLRRESMSDQAITWSDASDPPFREHIKAEVGLFPEDEEDFRKIEEQCIEKSYESYESDLAYTGT